jgi:urea transporter
VTEAILRGISEVMLQANVLTGAVFVMGILLSSWKGALWAVAGSLLGLVVGIEHQVPQPSLSLGIYGYNAALAAMALALYRRSVLLPIVAAVLSVPITEKFPLTGLATLTAPFVLASWAIIAMDRFDDTLNSEKTEGTG